MTSARKDIDDWRALPASVLHLSRDYAKSAAGITGPRRFDRCVQREKIGLSRDPLDPGRMRIDVTTKGCDEGTLAAWHGDVIVDADG